MNTQNFLNRKFLGEREVGKSEPLNYQNPAEIQFNELFVIYSIKRLSSRNNALRDLNKDVFIKPKSPKILQFDWSFKNAPYS